MFARSRDSVRGRFKEGLNLGCIVGFSSPGDLKFHQVTGHGFLNIDGFFPRGFGQSNPFGT